ncbi:MAG: methylcobamide--CoM methyltransferase [Clostridiales bacterium]|nr:methylcobamide--CoM methyltransferase [Clostridiales bacterium]
MNQKYERLMNVLNRKAVDRPPCICPGGMMNMVTKDIIALEGFEFKKVHHDSEMMAKLSKRVYDENCFENYGVPFCMTIEAEAFGAKVDFGKDDIEPHVIKYSCESVSDYKKLVAPKHNTARRKVVLDAIGILKADDLGGPIIGNITGPISTASSIMEPIVFYKELRKKSHDAHRFISIITDHLLAFALAQVEAGADVIAISDPSGTGEILGPKLFEEFMVPYINRITEAVHERGRKTIVHICGKMDKVYQQVGLIDTCALSFDALVNMKQAKTHLPNHTIMGNISTYTLEFGNPENIKQRTKVCLNQGVDIIAPACGLGMRSPIENIQAIIKTLDGVKNDNS